MERLFNPVREYAWGSRTVLARLRGRPVPSPAPEAELWMGAHPTAPSCLARGGGRVPLTEVIAADPDGVLGPSVARRFGPRLPYLFKLLAAEKPLSLQAHPDAEQARQGYAAEEAAGTAERNYVDQHHKPELLVAVTPFEALCGFRDPGPSADLLGALRVPALAPLVTRLRAGALGEVVRTLLLWPARERVDLVNAVVKAAAGDREGRYADEYGLAARLAELHPGDVGVVVALLLNRVTLTPGEAIWMPAGNLHAHVRGAGVEIMAASDNVLRGGLTPKRIDVPELLRVLRYTPLADPVLRPTRVAPGVVTWPVPAVEFALHRVERVAGEPPTELRLPGPRTTFCLAGPVTVDSGGDPDGSGGAVTLTPGEAAFGPATDAPLRVTGEGTVFVASVNL